jgi:hypothetical protein
MSNDIFGIAGRQFLGNNIGEWVVTIIGVILAFKVDPVCWIITFFWVENFFFWLLPEITFAFYHWKAYRNKMTIDEFVEMRRIKRMTKKMGKK